jgi:hypothetical protein
MALFTCCVLSEDLRIGSFLKDLKIFWKSEASFRLFPADDNTSEYFEVSFRQLKMPKRQKPLTNLLMLFNHQMGSGSVRDACRDGCRYSLHGAYTGVVGKSILAHHSAVNAVIKKFRML